MNKIMGLSFNIPRSKPKTMIERNEQENSFGMWRSSEVHILDGDGQRVRVMTVTQSNADEVHIEVVEEREIRPRSMYRI